jgi:two-component system chemotaxis response regulator CheY
MKRVLVIDESMYMIRYITMILEKYGFEVVAEADSEMLGIELYKELRPDIITVNAAMLSSIGIEVLRSIKRKNENIQVIVFGDSNQEKALLKSISVENYVFITAPFMDNYTIQNFINILLSLGGNNNEIS